MKWLQNLDKTIRGKTRRLNYIMKVERVTPNSCRETLSIFHDTFGHSVNYGADLAGEIHQCNFYSLIPFPFQNQILMYFEIPIQIDWEASYVHKGGNFSTAGAWVCKPRNGRKSRQMNRQFPRPVVGYYSGGAIITQEEGGHICTGEMGNTELILYPFCPKGKEALTVASYLNRIGDVISLLNKWSKE